MDFNLGKLKDKIKSVNFKEVVDKAKSVADKSMASVGMKDESLESLRAKLADTQAEEASLQQAIQKAEAKQFAAKDNPSASTSDIPSPPDEVQQPPKETEKGPDEVPSGPTEVPPRPTEIPPEPPIEHEPKPEEKSEYHHKDDDEGRSH